MNYTGIIVGLASFFIIGIFHPIVIKVEYYVGKKAWPVFLLAGIILIVFSVRAGSPLVSSIIGVAAFSCLWSIMEIKHQEQRVKKGWFPCNPKRKYD